MKPLTKFQCDGSHVGLAFILVLKGCLTFFFFLITIKVLYIILQLIDSSDIFKTTIILVMSADSTQVK